jgi:hypothetical protein
VHSLSSDSIAEFSSDDDLVLLRDDVDEADIIGHRPRFPFRNPRALLKTQQHTAYMVCVHNA